MSDDFLSAAELAARHYRALGSKDAKAAYAKLTRHRINGDGPQYTKTSLGAPVVYREQDFLEWLKSRTYRNTAEERARLYNDHPK